MMRKCPPESPIVLSVDFARSEDTGPLAELWKDTPTPAPWNWGTPAEGFERYLDARALLVARGERGLEAAVVVRWPGSEAWHREEADAGYIDVLVAAREEAARHLLSWTEDLIAGAGHRYARTAAPENVYLKSVGYEPSPMGLPQKALPRESSGAQFGRVPETPHSERPGAYGVAARADGTVLIVEGRGGLYLPGGGLAVDEDPHAGLKRELGEEAGYRVLLARPFARARQGLSPSGGSLNKLCRFFVIAVAPFQKGEPPEHRPHWLPMAEALDGLAEDASCWALSLVLARMVE